MLSMDQRGMIMGGISNIDLSDDGLFKHNYHN